MLQTVGIGVQSLSRYAANVGADLVAQSHALTAPLRGARILHINASRLTRVL